jgi:DNA-binding CsgD family transcriptional regulator
MKFIRCSRALPDGTQCKRRAFQDFRCFMHSGLERAEIFQWLPTEIESRIGNLTVRQIQALERVCDGHTYETAAEALGVAYGSFSNRLIAAKERAGVKTVHELIVLYAIWRVQIGVPMS